MHRNSRNNTDDLSRQHSFEANGSQRSSFANGRYATAAIPAAVVSEQLSPDAESDNYSYYSARDCFSDETSVRSSLSGYETATEEKADEPYQWWEQPKEILSVVGKDSPMDFFDKSSEHDAEVEYDHHHEDAANESPCIECSNCNMGTPIDEQAMEDTSGQISPGIEFIMNRTRQRTISQSVEAPVCQSVPPTVYRRRRPNSWNCEYYQSTASPTAPTTKRYDDSGVENFISDDTRQDFNSNQAPTGSGPRNEMRPVPTQSQRFSLPVDMAEARERVLPGVQQRWLPFLGDNGESNTGATAGHDCDANNDHKDVDPLESEVLTKSRESENATRQSVIASSAEDGETVSSTWDNGERKRLNDRFVDEKTMAFRKVNEPNDAAEETTKSASSLSMLSKKAASRRSYQEEAERAEDFGHNNGSTEENVDSVAAREKVEDRSGVVKKMIQMFSRDVCKEPVNGRLPKDSTERRKSVIDGDLQRVSSQPLAADSPKHSTRMRKTFANAESTKLGPELVTADLPLYKTKDLKSVTNGEAPKASAESVVDGPPKCSTQMSKDVFYEEPVKLRPRPGTVGLPIYATGKRKSVTYGETLKISSEPIGGDFTMPMINGKTYRQQTIMQHEPKRKICVTAKITLRGNRDEKSPTVAKEGTGPSRRERSTANLPMVVENVGWLNNVLQSNMTTTCQCSIGSANAKAAGVINTAKLIPVMGDERMIRPSATAPRQNFDRPSTSKAQHELSEPRELVATNTARICVVQATDGDSKQANRLTVPVIAKAAVSSSVQRAHDDDRLRESSRNAFLAKSNRHTGGSLPCDNADHVMRPKRSDATADGKKAKNASTLSVNGVKDDKLCTSSVDRHRREQHSTDSSAANSDARSGRDVWYTKFTETHIRWAYYQNSRAVMVDNSMTCRFANYENLSDDGNRSIVSNRTAFLQKQIDTQQSRPTSTHSCSSMITSHNGSPEYSCRRQWEPRNATAALADRRHKAMAVHTVLPSRRQSLIISTSSMKM